MKSLQHIHFILDGQLPFGAVIYQSQIPDFVSELMSDLKMYPLGKLEIYPATDLAFPGFSFIQPITTSHISGHYFEYINQPSELRFDIYSCKSFSWEAVVSLMNEHFQMNYWRASLIKRNIDASHDVTELEIDL